jgi:hypothetical protein
MADNPPFDSAVREIRDQIAGGPPPPPVDGRRPAGDDPNMDGRVKRLEDDVRAIRGDLTTIIGRLATLEGKLDTLPNQVVAKIPSGLQLRGIILGTLTGVVSIVAGVIALAQWLHLNPRT